MLSRHFGKLLVGKGIMGYEPALSYAIKSRWRRLVEKVTFKKSLIIPKKTIYGLLFSLKLCTFVILFVCPFVFLLFRRQFRGLRVKVVDTFRDVMALHVESVVVVEVGLI